MVVSGHLKKIISECRIFQCFFSDFELLILYSVSEIWACLTRRKHIRASDFKVLVDSGLTKFVFHYEELRMSLVVRIW